MSWSQMSSADGETRRTNAQQYSSFDAPPSRNNLYSVGSAAADVAGREVECCLPGSLFNCPLLTDTSACPTMMAQRCARVFDDKCALYASTKAQSSVDEYRRFLRETLRNRFCQLAPDSNCVQACEPFDPTAPSGSNLVCQVIGKETLADVGANSMIDVGLPVPVNISPVYQGNCAMVCNAKSPQDIDAQDAVVAECIRTGFCADILRQVCRDTDVASGSNTLLKTYCGVSSVSPAAPVSSDTYSDTYSPAVSDRVGKALTAIRQKLSSSSPVVVVPIGQTYTNTPADHSLLWVVVLLLIFYGVLYLLYKIRAKGQLGSSRRSTLVRAPALPMRAPPR